MTDKERFKRSEQWRYEVMKGDVAKDKCEFFKREDFESGGAFQTVLGISGPKVVECQVAAHTANRILLERGQRVYGEYDPKLKAPPFTTALPTFYRNTHTALLVCIEPIERDSAESLLREIYAEMRTWQDVDSPVAKLIERARKVLK